MAYRWPEILPGGRAVLFTRGTAVDQMEIALFDLETREQIRLIPGGANPRYSPTGHIVYGVDGTLRVAPFDLEGERQQVSTNGGVHPFWSRDGRELFYRSFADGRQVLAVPIQPGPTLRVGRPEVLFEGPCFLGTGPDGPYHLAPDGRFVMIKVGDATTDDASAPDVILVQNWAEELSAKVPTR